jgi:hypothetical protein
VPTNLKKRQWEAAGASSPWRKGKMVEVRRNPAMAGGLGCLGPMKWGRGLKLSLTRCPLEQIAGCTWKGIEGSWLGGADVSYAALQMHEIVNVALHREYSPGITFIFSQARKYLYHV